MTLAGLGSIGAVVVAVVLVLAAAAKLRRPDATAADFAELGLPAAPILARLVPAIEVLTALALVVVPAWGSILATALLIGFTVWLIGLVRSGVPRSCACFGGRSSEPVSWRTLARNLVLLGLAVPALPLTTLASPTLLDLVASSVPVLALAWFARPA